jgi:hypothetical protein
MTALLCIACYLLAQPADLRFQKVEGGIEVVAPLSAELKAKLPAGKWTQEQGEEWLRVCLVDGKTGKAGPAMFGAYERHGSDLIFRPRFALEPGQLYRASFGPEKQTVIAEHRVPSRTAGEAVRVVKVYPTADVLPANHLKFYVYFSQPMRGGQAMFEQFAILDEDGKEVYDPWLHDEIWDEKENCLIIYIHPGRIKWGIILRELLGPVLLPEKRYTFVIRGAILDAEGRPMGKDYVKKFRTTAEDRKRIAVDDWKLTSPVAGTREPVELRFATSIDHRSLGRLLSILDASGQRVAGAVEIGKDEKTWAFRPERPWANQEYRVTVDPGLEDVAGNTPRRPFDLDLKAPPLPAPTLERPFRAAAGS